MKILVTGISGLLGSEVARVLSERHDVLGISKTTPAAGFKNYNIDITDAELVYDTISKINPDIVIHSAAYSDVDGCEKNPDLAYKVNSLGTRNIAAACQRFDTALAYISTDYVFSGQDAPEEGYNEMGSPDPLSVYGRSKLAGEWYAKNLLNKFFIIRSSWLFGPKRKNFVSSIFEDLKNNRTIKQAADIKSAPTSVSDLSSAVAKLIETNFFGIYHLTNTGFASRYEVSVFIAKIVGCPTKNIEKISIKDLEIPAKRPAFSGLKNYVWHLNGFKPLRPWQEAVTDFISEHC